LLEGGEHGVRHVGAGQHIARAGGMFARCAGQDAQGAGAGVDGRRMRGVDSHQLAIRNKGTRLHIFKRLLRAAPRRHPVQGQRPQGGVGDVLADGGAHARASPDAARRHGRRRRGNGRAELAGSWATRNDGKGHVDEFGSMSSGR